jgi:hypothetical protein
MYVLRPCIGVAPRNALAAETRELLPGLLQREGVTSMDDAPPPAPAAPEATAEPAVVVLWCGKTLSQLVPLPMDVNNVLPCIELLWLPARLEARELEVA